MTASPAPATRPIVYQALPKTYSPVLTLALSPDGKTLAYCAEREGEYDVYTIPVTGGTETRLTTAKGLDDGPDYSPDGRKT